MSSRLSGVDLAARVKPALKADFLETLARCIEAVGWNVDAVETAKFYAQVCGIAGVMPRELYWGAERLKDAEIAYLKERVRILSEQQSEHSRVLSEFAARLR